MTVEHKICVMNFQWGIVTGRDLAVGICCASEGSLPKLHAVVLVGDLVSEVFNTREGQSDDFFQCCIAK